MDKSDRCDRCSAEAIHRMHKLGTKHDLYFCHHHFTAHESALLAQSWSVAESKLVPA